MQLTELADYGPKSCTWLAVLGNGAVRLRAPLARFRPVRQLCSGTTCTMRIACVDQPYCPEIGFSSIVECHHTMQRSGGGELMLISRCSYLSLCCGQWEPLCTFSFCFGQYSLSVESQPLVFKTLDCGVEMLFRPILWAIAARAVLAQEYGETGPNNSTTPITFEGEIAVHIIQVGKEMNQFTPNSIIANVGVWISGSFECWQVAYKEIRR